MPDLPTHVELRNFPTALGQRQDDLLEEVQREFQLMALALLGRGAGDPPPAHAMPPALAEMVAHLHEHYAVELDEPTRARQAAFEIGAESVTLRYPVLPETREITLAWRSMMEQTDVYCRQGRLLSLETPADLLALRTWILDEFLAQLGGASRRRGPARCTDTRRPCACSGT